MENYLRKNRNEKDCKGEKIIGQYLDKYFYPTWTKDITRNTERETQIQGVDLTVTSKDNIEYVIDEKATLWYANKDLETFAQEITSCYTGENNPKRGVEYNGWAISNTLNNYYVFVWIPECKTTGEVVNINDIITTDIALVKKEDMYSWYHKKGLTGNTLKEKSDELRKTVKLGINDYWNYVSGCNKSSLDKNGYKFHINTKTEENSVNILIKKDILINDISTYSVRINNGKITETYRKKL